MAWLTRSFNFGCRVFATARKPEALADLAAHGIETLRLDVTNGASVKEAVDAVLRAAGRIDLVIQNAGGVPADGPR